MPGSGRGRTARDDLIVRFDAWCKYQLSRPSVLDAIMRELLPEFSGAAPGEAASCIMGEPSVDGVPLNPDPERIVGSNTEDSVVGEGSVTFDIRFDAVCPEGAAGQGEEPGRVVGVDVEAQADYHPDYPLEKRAMYYCARMLSAQKGPYFKNADYGKLHKVYGVWVLPYPPARCENSLVRYHVAREQACEAGDGRPADHDLLEIAFVCLDGGRCEGKGLFGVLETLLQWEMSAEERRARLDALGVRLPRNTDERGPDMGDSLGAYLWERAEEKGMQQGMRQGVERSIVALMRNAGVGFSEAARMLGVPEAERDRYRDLAAAGDRAAAD